MFLNFVDQEKHMISIKRTDSNDEDFAQLVKHLDADLAKRDGEEHSFYNQFNSIALIKYALVAYEDTKPVGCGAIKEMDPETVEVKRMYVLPEHRGKGIAIEIVTALEQWAVEMEYLQCVLETGKKQPEAIALYKKLGYEIIPNYGQYIGIENSVCFSKIIKSSL